jgi:uncharacterized membrane protein
MSLKNAKKVLFLLILFSIFVIPNVSGAVVTGKVYDRDFQVLNNVVIEIDSFPKQTFVSKDGDYSFTLTSGRYNLIAFYKDLNNSVYFTNKEVLITVSGEYIVDLILDKPYEGALPDEFQVRPRYYNWVTYLLIGFLGILVLVLTFLLIRRRSAKKVENVIEKKEETDIDRTLKIIKENDGRITQKELRESLPRYSEAKVSLIITEMESKELIEKIKKGRGNVLILKGDK